MAIEFILRLASFIASYIQPPKLLRYTRTKAPFWAIVTGSTSGVGLALCSELCSRGFNIILHGRDILKLKAVQSELVARFPKLECDILVLDAATCFSQKQYDISQNSILEATNNRTVTLLINNVGMGHNLDTDFRPFTSQAPPSIDTLLNTNISFMTHLTQIMLPTLAESTPALIINIGSLAELAMPYIAVYSATKAYISAFTKALDAEMHAENLDIKVECMLFGDIDTPVHPMKQSLAVLGAEDAARCILDRGGSMGSWGLPPVGAPYWFHGLLLWLCQIQPWSVLRAGFIHNLKAKQTHMRQD
ncbi:hypothetical protein O988_03203 [Pseudogymnoascus sp. VKM F-3808]|nr:hypothetical protein O988_03203 [Pseudogymnoascus sp. VKM F-3808]